MTDPADVISKAIEKSSWAPGTDGWRDVEASFLARIALAALKEAGYEVRKAPIELNWYDE